MHPKPGLPVFNLFEFIQAEKIEHDILLLSLPDLLSCFSRQLRHHARHHVSCLDFYDIHQNCISEPILQAFHETFGIRIFFPQVVFKSEISGYWHQNKQKIPIYAVGDHPCAILAGHDQNTLSLNPAPDLRSAELGSPLR